MSCAHHDWYPIYEFGSVIPVEKICLLCGMTSTQSLPVATPPSDPGVSDEDFEVYRQKIMKGMR